MKNKLKSIILICAVLLSLTCTHGTDSKTKDNNSKENKSAILIIKNQSYYNFTNVKFDGFVFKKEDNSSNRHDLDPGDSLKIEFTDKKSHTSKVFFEIKLNENETLLVSTAKSYTVSPEKPLTLILTDNTLIKSPDDNKNISIGNWYASKAIKGISLNNTKLELNANASFKLVAAVLTDSTYTKADKTVTWTSSNTTVATVDKNGVVKTLTVGETKITAKAGYKTATCVIQVKPVDVSSISLNTEILTLNVRDEKTLTATVLPENATYKTVTWTSSNKNVATIDKNGRIKALAKGSTTITAKADKKTVTCELNVIVIDVENIFLNNTNLSLCVGEEETLTATVKPANATYKTVTWTSSNKNVATVDKNGKVKTIGAGSATITAKAEEKTATCNVNVKIPVEKISLNLKNLTLNVRDEETLTATVLPENATYKSVTWSSSNESVATVDTNGKIKAFSGGSATITAKADGKTVTCQVNVSGDKNIRYADLSNWLANSASDTEINYIKISEIPESALKGDTFKRGELAQKINDASKKVCITALELKNNKELKEMPKGAFYDTDNLVGINLLACANLEIIESSAFSQCKSLTSIELPASFTKVGFFDPFSDCSSLISIFVADKNPKFSSMDGILFNKEKTELIRYPATKPDISYTIPTSVTNIARGSFNNAKLLENIDFSLCTNLTNIESSAFYNCKALTTVNLPASITSIKACTFSHCEALTTVNLPASITSIGSSAFSGCKALTTINLPASITSIGNSAFEKCTGLTNIDLSASTKLTNIEYKAFYGCKNAIVKLPNANIEFKFLFGKPGNAFGEEFNSQVLKVKIPTDDDYGLRDKVIKSCGDGSVDHPYFPESKITTY